VDEQVIESIGGIEDTLKPLRSTLQQHELRPYSVHRDYRKDFIRSSRPSSRGPPESQSSRRVTEIDPEKMKLVSVSPFRAVVKVQDDDSVEEDEEVDLQRDPMNDMNAAFA
jgi:hypothetical protein